MFYTQTQELYHFGIPGQKWGVRRYENEDGTLTSAGKIRYRTDGPSAENQKRSDKFFKLETRDRVKEQRNARFPKESVNDNSEKTINKKALGKSLAVGIGIGAAGTALAIFNYSNNRQINDSSGGQFVRAAGEIMAKSKSKTLSLVGKITALSFSEKGAKIALATEIGAATVGGILAGAHTYNKNKENNE